ncbi:hypothetical protein AAFF_G00399630 [Aldrovandia affinis]|uniref:TNFR-Cys domain-containing protein n=1 Tax=Aldrovandia affinis TaxID=143900 RepID=A0AAD7SCX5_9TELE|nr:hypothetical protein AAFF_G00399630 [Aldrovandia affinis]
MKKCVNVTQSFTNRRATASSTALYFKRRRNLSKSCYRETQVLQVSSQCVDHGGAGMKAAWRVLLLLAAFLGCVDGVQEGCAQWSLSNNDDNICCDLCKQGNHMVKKCGPEAKKLCSPCKEGTYTVDPTQSTCRSCTQCIGVQKVMQACTSSSDTVCDCKAGYRCQDAKCSSCHEECGKGQQPAANLTCQACPPGTFSDRIHSQCVPWSTKCPQPDQKIVKQGTAVSDIICNFVYIVPVDVKGGKEWMLVAILVITILIVMVIMPPACIFIRRSEKKKMMMITDKMVQDKLITVSEEVRRLVQQEECTPQQEQGSSLESVASLDLKVKLDCMRGWV